MAAPDLFDTAVMTPPNQNLEDAHAPIDWSYDFLHHGLDRENASDCLSMLRQLHDGLASGESWEMVLRSTFRPWEQQPVDWACWHRVLELGMRPSLGSNRLVPCVRVSDSFGSVRWVEFNWIRFVRKAKS